MTLLLQSGSLQEDPLLADWYRLARLQFSDSQCDDSTVRLRANVRTEVRRLSWHVGLALLGLVGACIGAGTLATCLAVVLLIVSGVCSVRGVLRLARFDWLLYQLRPVVGELAGQSSTASVHREDLRKGHHVARKVDEWLLQHCAANARRATWAVAH